MKTHSPQSNRKGIRWKATAALVGSVLLGTASAQDTIRVKWDPNPETDIAGYTLYLGTASGYYSSKQVLSGVTSAALSGLEASTTYYCAVQAFNVAGLASELSTELSFTTSPSIPLNFSEWAAAAGLSGTAAAADAFPFHDGVSNLLKYAFKLDPSRSDTRVLTSGTGTAGLPLFSLERSGEMPSFLVEFLRRKNTGLVYTPMISTDLVTFFPMTGSTTVSHIDKDWERVVIRKSVDPAGTPKFFGRVEVMLP